MHTLYAVKCSSSFICIHIRARCISAYLYVYLCVAHTELHTGTHYFDNTRFRHLLIYMCIYIYTQVTIGIMSKYMQIHTCVINRWISSTWRAGMRIMSTPDITVDHPHFWARWSHTSPRPRNRGCLQLVLFFFFLSPETDPGVLAAHVPALFSRRLF